MGLFLFEKKKKKVDRIIQFLLDYVQEKVYSIDIRLRKTETEERTMKILNIEMKNVTNEITERIEKETTKKAAKVLDRINESAYYGVYECDNAILIESYWKLTEEEKSLIKKITKKEVYEFSRYMDSIGKWAEYIEWKKNGRPVVE